MKAIITRYLPPAGKLSARYKATDGRNTITVKAGQLHDGNSAQLDHANTARALCVKMGWKGELVGGFTEDGTGHWCFLESERVKL